MITIIKKGKIFSMRYSRKREIIKEAVCQNRIHPTADQVYEIVRQSHPEISLGTVYRNLNLLAEQGELQKLTMADGPDRFDGTLKPHQHTQCAKCGKVEDFDFDLSQLEAAIREQTDITPRKFIINVSGLCCDCAAKEPHSRS